MLQMCPVWCRSESHNQVQERKVTLGRPFLLDCSTGFYRFWLVVYLPLWKIWVRQLGWWNSQLNGKIKHVSSKPPTTFFKHHSNSKPHLSEVFYTLSHRTRNPCAGKVADQLVWATNPLPVRRSTKRTGTSVTTPNSTDEKERKGPQCRGTRPNTANPAKPMDSPGNRTSTSPSTRGSPQTAPSARPSAIEPDVAEDSPV